MPDYYAILGVPRTASTEDIKAAYLRLARENHPDRFTDSDQRAAAARRIQEINESYNVLRDEKLRREYDRRLERQALGPEQEAALFYKDARLREEARDYDEALKRYYEAMRLDPSKVDYILGAARLLARDRSKQRQAAELLSQAIDKAPDAREVYLELGALYSRAGLLLRAKRVYQQGLSRLPKDAELSKRLAAVEATEKSRSR